MQLSRIPLNGGYFCLVDEEDLSRLSNFRWYTRKERGRIYAACTSPEDYTKKIKIHRFILGIYDPKIIIDHINGDGLDNRKANLRICDRKQNAQNVKKHKDGISKYKGVTFCKHTNKWRAQLTYNGKSVNIGRFKTEIEAAINYDKHAILHHGEFARLNFKNGNI